MLAGPPVRVVARNMNCRALVVIPMNGNGTHGDPKRPGLMPANAAALPTGIIGFSFEPSDDGKYAIVEFVASSRDALATFLGGPGNGNGKGNNYAAAYGAGAVKIFENNGQQKRDDIEKELRKYKKDFSLHTFGGER
jgi:hypothetical protein